MALNLTANTIDMSPAPLGSPTTCSSPCLAAVKDALGQTKAEQQTEAVAQAPPAEMNNTQLPSQPLKGPCPAAAVPQAPCPDQGTAATSNRLEQLMEQQNMLMQRQLQLSEEKVKHSETMKYTYVTQQKFLQALDPCVRGIFKSWHREFCKNIQVYVKQWELSAKYQEGTAKGELLKPFLDEAQKPWAWEQFYRSVAKPIDGVDPSPATMLMESAETQSPPCDTLPSSEGSKPYDIDSAFAEMRARHAWELQNFVTAHHKVCLEKIIEDLALPHQVQRLQEELASWAAQHNGFYHPQSKQHLESQAKDFVELVYREEMPKAQNRIKAGKMSASSVIVLMRICCLISVLLAAATMRHELLTRLFASLFALLCGMALLWEDLVMSCVRLLLGQTVKRLRVLGTVTENVPSCTNFNIHVPSLVW